ncbi:MAG: hypothetical protein AMXMBFR58_26580 [Phycisphaerae bacterium]
MKRSLCMVAVLAAGTTASAVNIPAGYDYLMTDPGTYFDFGPGIGPVNFRGVPIDPSTYGDADTIVERKAPAIFPAFGTDVYPNNPLAGTGVTIPIEMLALELASTAPIYIGESFFDVWVSLDPATPTLGAMTIEHQWTDTDGQTPEGTFDSFFDVFAIARFEPVGGGVGFEVPIQNLRLASTGTLWSHWPYGIYIDQVIEQHPGVGVHIAHSVEPAPATWLAIVCAAPIVAPRRRAG